MLGVDDVEVSGVTGAEAAAVSELVAVPTGTPLARVDTDAVADRVRERITVAEVSVRRSWPGTLTVDVVPRTAALVVKNPQGRLEVVDAEGIAFAVVRHRAEGRAGRHGHRLEGHDAAGRCSPPSRCSRPSRRTCPATSRPSR